MRVLSKIVVMAVCVLVLVTLAGCDSGFQMKEGDNSIIINGWELTSPDGIEAIRSCTASDVVASKNEELGDVLYLIELKGNSQSVLECVEDPFFGKGTADYSDPRVQAYLAKIEKEDPSLIGTRSIHITANPVDTVSPDRVTYRQTDYYEIPVGYTKKFYLGCRGNEIAVNAKVSPYYPNTAYKCQIYVAPILVFDLEKYTPAGGSPNSITISNPQYIQSVRMTWGLWQWAVQFQGIISGYADVDIYW